ncbi:MAG: hypothetical protein K8F91_10780 [Candidatus Obscuribacterales bacterium]|nr:hypothetical protein [Candidatus Obscuribacterales bacterium]
MQTLELKIDQDTDGKHHVSFAGSNSSLIPPGSYAERIKWIEESFRSFYGQVQDLDALKKDSL